MKDIFANFVSSLPSFIQNQTSFRRVHYKKKTKMYQDKIFVFLFN